MPPSGLDLQQMRILDSCESGGFFMAFRLCLSLLAGTAAPVSALTPRGVCRSLA
jgi:hypothetical protein